MTYDRVLTLARTQLVIVYTKFLPRFSQKLSIESKPILVLGICGDLKAPVVAVSWIPKVTFKRGAVRKSVCKV